MIAPVGEEKLVETKQEIEAAGKRLLKTAGTLVVRVRVTIDDRNGTSETIEQDVTLVRRSR